MVINHVFRSGNGCDIYIPENIGPGLLHNRVEWERFPPGPQDLREYSEEVLPAKVIPAMAAVLQRANRSGRFIEVAPGIWGWMEAGSRN
jgi:hypothetical protein